MKGITLLSILVFSGCLPAHVLTHRKIIAVSGSDRRLRFEQQLHSALLGDDNVTYLGLHNLWSDRVVFRKDTSFARVDYPELGGKWFAKGNVLTMAWEGWGISVLTTDDGGETFSKWGFRLENINAEPLPNWWASGVQLTSTAYAIKARNSKEIIWTFRDGLPEDEGYDLIDVPPLSSVQECKDWCGHRNDCSGFAASIETGRVTKCVPKQAATGFSPESAVWLKDKTGNGSAWQFHWKGDEKSLQINDDGSSQLLRCPVGLVQHPTHMYQCSNPLDRNRALFNKDGTMNLEQFMVESIAWTWEDLSQDQGTSVSEHIGTHGAVNASARLALKWLNPIPGELTHLLGTGLLAAGKAFGAGVTGMGWAGKSILWSLHLLHGPLLPIFASLALSWEFYNWYAWATAAQNAVQSLINKSVCMQMVKYEYDSPIRSEDLSSTIASQCGRPIADAMLQQVPSTIHAMEKMFASMEQAAWCMHHNGGELAYSFGAACSADVMPTLKGAHGRPGPITAMVMIAAIYAFETDRLFIDSASPNISSFLRRAFLDPDYPDLIHPEMPATLEQLSGMKGQDKKLSCFGLLVTQRSYEHMFSVLADAFKLWMRTFGVDDAENFWYDGVCREHYNDMSDPATPICKRADSKPAHHSGTECDTPGKI